MRVLYCQEHESIADIGGNVCHAKSAFHRYDESTCRMVPMRLGPHEPTSDSDIVIKFDGETP